MSKDVDWKRTQDALVSLEIELKCIICKSVAKDPIKYGVCGDFFCRRCVDPGSSICPSCGILSRATEVRPDKTVQALISGWKRIAGIVNATKFGVDLNEDESSVKSDPMKKNETGDSKMSVEECVEARERIPLLVEGASTAPSVSDSASKRSKATNKENTANNVAGKKPTQKTRKLKEGSKKREAVKGDSEAIPETNKELKSSNRQAKLQQQKREEIPEYSVQKQDSNKHIPGPESVDQDSSAFGFETPRQAAPQSNKIKTPKCHTPLKDLMKRNKKGETLLHVACIKGNLSQLKSLLAAGANPNTKDNAGWTPLHEAVSQGFVQIIELLLDAGAFVDVPGVDNMTALHEAVLGCKPAIVEILVSRGANPAARTLTGKTARDLSVTEEIKNALETPVLSQLSTVQENSKKFVDVEPTLCFVGLDKSSKKELSSIATNLGLRVVQLFSTDITHLIVAADKDNVCPPSMEVLSAILCGCWILNRDWLSLSQESKEMVDPTIFEILGMTDYIGDGPKRGRNNAWKQLPGLFNGIHFFVLPSAEMKLGDCLISRKDLTSLIQYGGGAILSREPRAEDIPEREKTVPYHATESSDLRLTSHVILYDPAKAPKLKYNMVHIKTLPVEWLIACIANWNLMDPPQG